MATKSYEDKPIAEWTPQNVAGFLTTLKLGDYVDPFAHEAIGGAELMGLTDNDLRTIGVSKLGHRKLLLKQIAHIIASKSGLASATASEQVASRWAFREMFTPVDRVAPDRNGTSFCVWASAWSYRSAAAAPVSYEPRQRPFACAA